jgi:hypothetical protein
MPEIDAQALRQMLVSESFRALLCPKNRTNTVDPCQWSDYMPTKTGNVNWSGDTVPAHNLKQKT